MSIYTPTAGRSGRMSWQVAVILLILVAQVAYRIGQIRPDQVQWSEHATGPLLCVSNGTAMQCATKQMAVMQLPPGFKPQSGSRAEPQLSAQQLGCIALAVFGESRGESYLGQAAVARTVINRALKAAQTPCDTVQEPSQFQAVEAMRDDPWTVDPVAWQRALEVATVVASGDYDTGACSAATAFHSGAAPDWAAQRRLVCEVGAHKFYAEG